MLDLKRQYAIAKTLVGDLNEDLVHLCYELVHEKLPQIPHQNTYFTRVMINEVRERGRFSTRYAIVHPKVVVTEWDTSEHVEDQSQVRLSMPKLKEAYAILDEIANDGHAEEVEIFEMYIHGASIKQINRITGTHRTTLKKCIEFVAEETRRRYDSNSN